MKRVCPSSVDVSCKFQNQIRPPSTLEKIGKSQMTAHHRYSEQVLLEAQLLKMVLGWHSQRKETENIKKKKEKKPSSKQIQKNNFSWEIRRDLFLLLFRFSLLIFFKIIYLLIHLVVTKWKPWQTLFSWAPKSIQMVTAAMKLKEDWSFEEKLWQT